jgi:hypothetical protein
MTEVTTSAGPACTTSDAATATSLAASMLGDVGGRMHDGRSDRT